MSVCDYKLRKLSYTTVKGGVKKLSISFEWKPKSFDHHETVIKVVICYETVFTIKKEFVITELLKNSIYNLIEDTVNNWIK